MKTTEQKIKAPKYAEKGFSVFPVQPGEKRPCGRLVPNGVKQATTDPQKVRDWWNGVPSANIGLATGTVFVIDLDVKNDTDGIKEWERLRAENGGAPHTTAVRTPSGGIHLYYRAPASVEIKNSASELAPGVDVRGHGGYVVAPPSMLDDGGTYTFMKGSQKLADAPFWLVSMVRKDTDGPPQNGQQREPADLPESVTDGRRNNYLARWGGRLRRYGMTAEEMKAALSAVNQNRCTPPLPEDEVHSVAESVERYEPEDPITPHNNGTGSEQSAQVHPGKHSDETPDTEGNPPEWMPFPTDLLPSAVAQYVRAHAKAKSVDEAMVAVPSLPVLAAAVGNSREVQIKRSWTERSILWMSLVALSGDMKSPSLEASVKPVNRLEVKAKESHDLDQEQYEHELKEYNQLPQSKKKVTEPPQEPQDRQRYRVGNVTLEAIIQRHSTNPRSLLLVRDELAGWIGSFDRYAQGESDLQDWIEMYEGRLVQSDRVSSGTTDIKNPCVSVVGTTQPKVLERKLTDVHFSSGFAARLMIVRPPSQKRRFTTADVTRDTSDAYAGLVRTLYDIPHNGDPEPVGLSRDALQRFGDFVNQNAEIQEQLPEGPLRSKLSKIEAIAARLALILQLTDDPRASEVSDNAMHRATLLAEWFRHESARIHHLHGFREASLPEDEQKAQQLPDWFKWQDVAEVWGVQRRQSFNICKRLVRKGLATDEGKDRGYSLTERAKPTSGPEIVAEHAPSFDSFPEPMPAPAGDSAAF
jgi:hypothetical protein